MEDDREASVEGDSAIGRLIREVMKAVLDLDVLSHNKYSRNPDKLRAGLSASRMERAAALSAR